jgi:hypothetical protein
VKGISPIGLTAYYDEGEVLRLSSDVVATTRTSHHTFDDPLDY